MRQVHPSVVALLAAQQATDPADAIRGRARQLVAEATALGWSGPPFDLSQLASLRRLKVTVSNDLADDQDACVMPGHILLNSRKAGVRRRYSLAHEIAHTLFPDYEAEVRRAGRLWRRDGDDSQVEWLCQVAASELLFPLDAFRSAISAAGLTLLGVMETATSFDASMEAAIRRTVETATDPVAGFIVRPIDANSGEWLTVSSRDDYSPYQPLAVAMVCCNDASAMLRLARGAAPPKNGAAERAWKSANIARRQPEIRSVRRESWVHIGASEAWDTEAITLPRGNAVPREILCFARRSAA